MQQVFCHILITILCYHLLKIRDRKRKRGNVSSSKIISLETPYKKSFQGEKRAWRCSLSLSLETKRNNANPTSEFLLWIVNHHRSERISMHAFEIYFLSIEESKVRKGKKNLLDIYIPSTVHRNVENSFAIFRFVRLVRGLEEERRRARCRDKEISGVTRHEFSCKARVHYDLSNPAL